MKIKETHNNHQLLLLLGRFRLFNLQDAEKNISFSKCNEAVATISIFFCRILYLPDASESNKKKETGRGLEQHLSKLLCLLLNLRFI